jgi:hypothetical protein
MVKAGAVITFDVQGTTGEYLPRSADSVRAIVINGLTPFFDVQDVSIETDSFLSDPLHYLSNWRYDATVRIKVLTDYGDIRDVDSVIGHAFYDGAGNLPTVTARAYEQGQGDAQTIAPGGFSVKTLLVLAVVGLVALAVVKGETLAGRFS